MFIYLSQVFDNNIFRDHCKICEMMYIMWLCIRILADIANIYIYQLHPCCVDCRCSNDIFLQSKVYTASQLLFVC